MDHRLRFHDGIRTLTSAPADPCFWSMEEQATSLRRRELSARELVQAYIERIESLNRSLNAFVTVLAEEALETAGQRDSESMKGERLRPLHGLPIAIKDLFDFKAGVRNTFGSAPLSAFVPTETSTYVKRLEAAGAIVVGKTNTPEFGHKGLTDSPLLGPCSTPFRVGYNSGGSSGGSAAAVAAALCSAAQGSDGGGSIRIPAAWCGVYGFKATFGVVASVGRPNGFTAHTPFIHAGPLTRTVKDSALMLDAMSGACARDPFSIPKPTNSFSDAVANLSESRYRIAADVTFGGFPVEKAIADVFESLLVDLETAGHIISPISIDLGLPHTRLTDLWLRQAAWINAKSATSIRRSTGIDLLAEGVVEELTPEFAEMLRRGSTLDIETLVTDDESRTTVLHKVEDVFDEHDFILTATVGHPPVENAADGSTIGPSAIGDNQVDPLIGWCLTHPVNMTGHPAASIPAGQDPSGFPVGVQIVGRKFDDALLLQLSREIESMRPWLGLYDTIW